MAAEISSTLVNLDNFIFGNNWNDENTTVLLNWITVASYSIEALDKCINLCRSRIRINTIISLGFSTASGSLSVTTFNKNSQIISTILNAFLTTFSFTIAIIGSYIKVYQFQERLELYIKTKQEWIAFVGILSLEMELPVNLRRDAKQVIKLNINKYNDLLAIDYELFPRIKKEFTKNVQENTVGVINKTEGLKIYDIMLNNVKKQFKKLNENEEIIAHAV